MWYVFRAYNTEAQFGWTQIPAVAKAALEWLNRDREINVYSMDRLGDAADETGQPNYPEALPLRDRTDLLFDDDTQIGDFTDWRE